MLKVEESAGHSLPNLQSLLSPRLEPSGVANQPRAHMQKNCTGPPKRYGLQLGLLNLFVDFYKVKNVT